MSLLIHVFNVQLLKVLLSLRIKEVDMKTDAKDIAPKKTFMTFKEKKKNLSRMQRKVNASLIESFRVNFCFCMSSNRLVFLNSGRKPRRSWRKNF